MDDNDRTARPLGWWLKEADARIDDAFDRGLGSLGLDRRRWQILATLARGPLPQGDIAAALSRFDDDAEIAAVVADLLDHGMVHRGSEDVLEITDRGAQAHQQAANRSPSSGHGSARHSATRVTGSSSACSGNSWMVSRPTPGATAPDVSFVMAASAVEPREQIRRCERRGSVVVLPELCGRQRCGPAARGAVAEERGGAS
ncbi:hypothetical protein BH23ACT10_BH23ACT10_30360 [soil metagenome]